ncbi:GNAT family N-acetyltransferase [Streptomyces sp. NPDC058718]|uniref:GNAT family N-acetyltransferase n=1 Tax=Streptomyces sp. NPDC058718 TaxID=3346610 RepID=UPI003674F65E
MSMQSKATGQADLDGVQVRGALDATGKPVLEAVPVVAGTAGADGGPVMGRLLYVEPESLAGSEAGGERIHGPVLVALSTHVKDAYTGRGVAGALAGELYRRAGDRGATVVPLCSYVARWIGRHPDAGARPDEALTCAAEQAVTEDSSLW